MGEKGWGDSRNCVRARARLEQAEQCSEAAMVSERRVLHARNELPPFRQLHTRMGMLFKPHHDVRTMHVCW